MTTTTTTTVTTAIDAPDLTAIAEHYAARLARPEPPPADKPWAGQSLSIGAAGVALLHVERALAGTGSWRHAHQWIASAVAGTVSANDHTGLYLGAPAIAFLLDAAATGAPDRYRGALVVLDQHVAALAHRRGKGRHEIAGIGFGDRDRHRARLADVQRHAEPAG